MKKFVTTRMRQMSDTTKKILKLIALPYIFMFGMFLVAISIVRNAGKDDF